MNSFHLILLFAIQMTGLFHFLLASANFLLPGMLGYRENLAKVSPIIREIFLVHALYIVIILIGFGGICLLYPADLSGASPLGMFFSGFLAFFWSSRVFIQFFFYNAEIKKKYPVGNFCFSALFVFFALVFLTAALSNL